MTTPPLSTPETPAQLDVARPATVVLTPDSDKMQPQPQSRKRSRDDLSSPDRDSATAPKVLGAAEFDEVSSTATADTSNGGPLKRMRSAQESFAETGDHDDAESKRAKTAVDYQDGEETTVSDAVEETTTCETEEAVTTGEDQAEIELVTLDKTFDAPAPPPSSDLPITSLSADNKGLASTETIVAASDAVEDKLVTVAKSSTATVDKPATEDSSTSEAVTTDTQNPFSVPFSAFSSSSIKPASSSSWLSGPSSAPTSSTPTSFGKFGTGSLFGSTPSKSSTLFGDSSAHKPFSSFSSNPFLTKFAEKKSDEPSESTTANEEEGNDANEDEDSKSGEDAAAEPYVQLKLEEQKVETGEEMENSVFNCRAKLYSLDPTVEDKGWKERGVGVLHLNIRRDTPASAPKTTPPPLPPRPGPVVPLASAPSPLTAAAQDSKSSNDDSSGDGATRESSTESAASRSRARIVMRADGILKVILNLPLSRGRFEISQGMKSSLASEKFVRISTFENGKPIQYALRMGSENVALDLFKQARALLDA
ncbi:uncharacterized protein V1518DRAFT_421010 [Limtongia smithiae]|uniref:uncharacterized protein n=1 Tax=Limtongia smithiae TaxID=1125753 RepID=UPI0034CFC3B9